MDGVDCRRQARVLRNLYIQLPAEDEQGCHNMLGKLRLNLYGTRDGACDWQQHLVHHMESIGSTRGIDQASVFGHKKMLLMCLVHGDDYVSAGDESEILRFGSECLKSYELRTQRLGPNMGAEGKVLNRRVRWLDGGWELEADPRHAELIQEQLGTTSGGGITTAGSPQEDGGLEVDEEIELLAGKDITRFRGVAARCDSLPFDRPDIHVRMKTNNDLSLRSQ